MTPQSTMRGAAVVACLALAGAGIVAQGPAAPARSAIVGGTLIDGSGGAPIADAVILIEGTRITAAGARSAVTIPAGAQPIDARGRRIVPGLVDTNVHLSLYGGQNDRYETMAKYQPRQDDIVLEAAQIDLGYGVTTVREPWQAIVAAPRNGALAARGLKDFGTIEPGKMADLVVLAADPLAEIANLRKVAIVMQSGRVVDRPRLPHSRVLSVAPPGTKAF